MPLSGEDTLAQIALAGLVVLHALAIALAFAIWFCGLLLCKQIEAGVARFDRWRRIAGRRSTALGEWGRLADLLDKAAEIETPAGR